MSLTVADNIAKRGRVSYRYVIHKCPERCLGVPQVALWWKLLAEIIIAVEDYRRLPDQRCGSVLAGFSAGYADQSPSPAFPSETFDSCVQRLWHASYQRRRIPQILLPVRH